MAPLKAWSPRGTSLARLNPGRGRLASKRASLFGKGGRKMPEKRTIARARRDKRAGKAPTTQAGEFVREEMDHIREGKHGARSTKQAIAIGLSKARRAGVRLRPPARGRASASTRRRARQDYRAGMHGSRRKLSARRSRAVTRALRREGSQAASRTALGGQARQSRGRRRGTRPAPRL